MKIIAVFCLFLGLCFITPVHADSSVKAAQARAQARAQKVIDACRAISQEDRGSGVTSRMREGTLNTALCMEEHIIMLAKTELFKESPEISEKIEQGLEDLRFAYGRFYWDLYNNTDACMPLCGTFHHVRHSGKYALLLEGILFDCYQEIEIYK